MWWWHKCSACCTGGSVLVCACCAIAPAQWTFTVAGVTTNAPYGCDCTIYNATWTLNWIGGCVWNTYGDVHDPPCTVIGSSRWTLGCDGVKWFLMANGNIGDIVFYETPVASFDCLLGGILTRTSAEPYCLTWPATITLAPV